MHTFNHITRKETVGNIIVVPYSYKTFMDFLM